MSAIESTTAVFSEAANRLAGEIDDETRRAIAAGDPAWLRDIARSATTAIDQLAAARQRTEIALFEAREQARR